MAINPADQKALAKAIADSDIAKIEALLAKDVRLLNSRLPVKDEKYKASRSPSKIMRLTALGWAIYLGQEAVVRHLLMCDGLLLDAGSIVFFSEAEAWANHLRKTTIAQLIKDHKAMRSVSTKAPTADTVLDDPIVKLYSDLKRNELELAETEFATLQAQPVHARKQDDKVILQLIDMLTLETKRTRWILTRNNKQETLAGSRDEYLDENSERIAAQKAKLAKKLRLTRQIIKTFCPELTEASDEDLAEIYQAHVRTKEQFFGDYSDDSDSEDEAALGETENRNKSKKTAQFAEIKSVPTTDDRFWPKTNRQNLITKLREVVEEEHIAESTVKHLTQTLFSRKRDREELRPTIDPERKKFVAQFRGVNYMSDRWSIQARRYHYRMEELGLAQFSESVLKTLAYNFYTDLGPDKDFYLNAEDCARLVAAAKHLRDGYLALKAESKPVIEKSVALKDTDYLYNDPADFLQSEYTNGISQHLLELREYRRRNLLMLGERMLNSFNYAISTSDCPNHALRYALGLKTYYADNFDVRYNKDGSIVNSHVGKVYIIMQETSDFNNPGNVNHVLRMAHEGKVPISKVGGVDIANELENDYIGSISATNVVYQLRLKFPSFNGPYKTIYAMKYGLNEELYKLFATLISKTWDKDPKNPTHMAAIQLLKEWLCAYYEVLLLSLAQDKAHALGGDLVYIHHDGTECKMPDFVPFNPGDAHLPDRNIVHILQNFRSTVPRQRFLTESETSIDAAIDAVATQLTTLVVCEPAKPEGFVKIADEATRKFYLALEAENADPEVKKGKIVVRVLQEHKHTLPSHVQVPEPLVFSRKRIRLESTPSDEKLTSHPEGSDLPPQLQGALLGLRIG